MNSYDRIYKMLVEMDTPSTKTIIKAQKGLEPQVIRKINRLMTTKTPKGEWRTLDQARKEALK